MFTVRPLIFVSVLALVGCNALQRPDRFELAPITVDGTTYQVYELVESFDPNLTDPRQDPEAVRSVFVILDGQRTLFCGPSREGCANQIIQNTRRTPPPPPPTEYPSDL